MAVPCLCCQFNLAEKPSNNGMHQAPITGCLVRVEEGAGNAGALDGLLYEYIGGSDEDKDF